jgi:hypothetical protein
MMEGDRPEPPVPSAVVAAAAAAGLGAHIATEPRPDTRLTTGGHLLAFGVLLTLLGGCSLALFTTHSATASVTVLLGAVGTATALGFAASRKVRPSPTLYCYDRGVVAEPRSGGEPRTHPWSAVRTHEWTSQVVGPNHSRPEPALDLHTADHREIVRYYGNQAERVKQMLARVSTQPPADDDGKPAPP